MTALTNFLPFLFCFFNVIRFVELHAFVFTNSTTVLFNSAPYKSLLKSSLDKSRHKIRHEGHPVSCLGHSDKQSFWYHDWFASGSFSALPHLKSFFLNLCALKIELKVILNISDKLYKMLVHLYNIRGNVGPFVTSLVL